MAHEEAEHEPALSLPPQVSGPVELARLIRELERLDEALRQAALRKSGEAVKLPPESRLPEIAAKHNKLNLLQATDREQLLQMLRSVQQTAPVLHVSLTTEPSPLFAEKLLTWLRREIHPQALVSFGLQPNLGAGCVVRSTNKFFDFSLRRDLAAKQEMLRQALVGSTPTAEKTVPAEVA